MKREIVQARLHSKLWVPDPFKFRDNLKAALDRSDSKAEPAEC